VFDPVLPYEAVLATRRWRPGGGEVWHCSYAVVALPEIAPPDPPPVVPPGKSEQALRFPEWILRFGGAWVATPLSQTPDADYMRGWTGACFEDLPDDVNDQILNGLTEPGSWGESEPAHSGTFHVYSAPQRIVARIRFGD
jgi:hypothetical protein